MLDGAKMLHLMTIWDHTEISAVSGLEPAIGVKVDYIDVTDSPRSKVVPMWRVWFRHARQKIFPNHITRSAQEELPSNSVLRTSTTKVIPIKIASWIASQLEVCLRSVQLDLSYLRNNGFIKKTSKSTHSARIVLKKS